MSLVRSNCPVGMGDADGESVVLVVARLSGKVSFHALRRAHRRERTSLSPALDARHRNRGKKNLGESCGVVDCPYMLGLWILFLYSIIYLLFYYIFYSIIYLIFYSYVILYWYSLSAHFMELWNLSDISFLAVQFSLGWTCRYANRRSDLLCSGTSFCNPSVLLGETVNRNNSTTSKSWGSKVSHLVRL